MSRHYHQFSLFITSDEFAAYYEGIVKNVLVTTYSGLKLQFPANVLREYLSHNGIKGSFEIEVDENNKFVSICRI